MDNLEDRLLTRAQSRADESLGGAHVKMTIEWEARERIAKLEAEKVFLLEQGIGAWNDALEEAAKVADVKTENYLIDQIQKQSVSEAIRALKTPPEDKT